MRGWSLLLLLFLPLSQATAQSANRACSIEELMGWREAVHAALLANWKVPYEDRYIACTVMLSVNWRGEVLNVGIANCGEDPQVHRSVVNAGYQSSPIRMLDNRACYERNVIVKLESRPLQPEEREESVDPE
ncbi:MAG TPA: hypothetical protein VLA06_04030 [Woeseiaceae bacterium]|jgi:hypothetical protein|nr:hypothetical protein [Woeseiaceae bacterium]